MTSSDRELRTISGLREDGFGGMNRMPDPEKDDEKLQNGETPYARGKDWKLQYEGKKGAVEVLNEIDDVFDNPGSVDPLYIIELDEFLKERFGEGISYENGMDVPGIDREELKSMYAEWRMKDDESDRDDSREEKTDKSKRTERHFKPGGVPIDLSTQAAQHDTAVSLAFEDLDPVWGDEKTVAHYIFGEKGKPDVIAFTNSELVGTRKGGAVAIEVSKFNEVLEASDIKMRLRRPKHGDPTNVQKVLSNLRLGKKGSRYGGEKTRIIYPEKPKEDKKKPEATKTKVEALQPMEGKFNIYINGKELDRLTKDVHGPGADEAQKNRDSVNDFAYYLSSEQENVESLMFLTDSVDGSEPTKIKAVVLQVLDIPKGGTREDAERKSIVIPIHIFNRVFNSTEPYHKFNKQENEVVGVKFRTKLGSGGGWEGFIHPKTNDENLQKVIDKMRFEGKSLSSDIKVSIGPRKEYSPQVAETPVAEAA